MRILVLSDLGPRCGSTGHGSFLPPRLRALAGQGHEVRLVLPRVRFRLGRILRGGILGGGVGSSPCDPEDPVREANRLLAGGPDWHLVGIEPGPLREAHLRTGSRARLTRYAARQVLEQHPGPWDLVQAHGWYAPVSASEIAPAAAGMLGAPFTVTLHGGDVAAVTTDEIPGRRAVLERAADRLFVSSGLRRAAVERGLCRDGSVIPNGVDLRVFPGPVDPGPARASNGRSVCFVGNLVAVKGVQRLPGVMREVWRHDPGVRLDIVGSGDLASTLRAELPADRTTFHGQIPQSAVARVLSGAGVLVMPSVSEGFGCAALEAQAMGVPVVATRVGGLPESVGTGGELVSAEPFRPEEMATAVLRWLGSSDKDALRRRAEQFSWEKIGEQESRLLERLVAEAGAGRA